jgi:hypothetical protein
MIESKPEADMAASGFFVSIPQMRQQNAERWTGSSAYF